MKLLLTRPYLVPIALFLLLISSCAPQQQASLVEESDIESEALSIDLFSARGFLGGSEYERYYLTKNVLWRECGTISKARDKKAKKIEGDDIFAKDPNLAIEQRRVENLSSSETRKLRSKVKAFLNSVSSEGKQTPSPGSVFALSGPGLFEVNVQYGFERKHFITSVDAVADKENNALVKAHELFSTLRSLGPVICEAKTFFGIPRATL